MSRSLEYIIRDGLTFGNLFVMVLLIVVLIGLVCLLKNIEITGGKNGS